MPAPRIFISHGSHDADFTRDLSTALTAAGADAWYLDQHDRGPLEIGPAVEKSLRERNILVYVVSPDAIGSDWVQLESRWYWHIWRLQPNDRFILLVAASDFDLLTFTKQTPFLSEFKRVEQRPGIALPRPQAIAETLMELGLTLTMGAYPPDVVEVIRQKYVELGAIASTLGRPDRLRPDLAAPTVSPRGTSGYAYPFQHGVMRWCAKVGAHPIGWGVNVAYAQLRTEGTDIGFPLTDELSAAQSPQRTEGVYQRFEGAGEDYAEDVPRVPDIHFGATVYWSKGSGAHATWGAIGEYYERAHGTGGELGFPITDVQNAAPSPSKTEGKYQEFEGGTIYWCSSAGAHPVRGEIREAYHQQSRTLGRLGFPITDELGVGADAPYRASPFGTTGTLQRFEGDWRNPGIKDYYAGVEFGATIYQSKHGTYATWGGIEECYEELDGAGGSLGFPTSPERDAAQSPQGTVGKYQKFEGGILCWCEKYNFAPIAGRILAIYNRYAGSGGVFGFPIAAAEEVAVADSGRAGRLQRFEGGIIYVEGE